MANNVISVTREELLTMEHDFIANALFKQKTSMKNGCDMYVCATDFMIYADAIHRFVRELLGEDPIEEIGEYNGL